MAAAAIIAKANIVSGAIIKFVKACALMNEGSNSVKQGFRRRNQRLEAVDPLVRYRYCKLCTDFRSFLMSANSQIEALACLRLA